LINFNPKPSIDCQGLLSLGEYFEVEASMEYDFCIKLGIPCPLFNPRIDFPNYS